MKIEYIVGDLFKTDAEVIAHGCNAQGVMGSGVARTVRDDYPKAYQDYVAAYDKIGLRLGAVIYSMVNPNLIIANMITQERFGHGGTRWVSYDAIATAMETLNKDCRVFGVNQVAMPMIGAGLGGGNWDIIEQIIESSMVSVQPVVYLLEPLKRDK